MTRTKPSTIDLALVAAVGELGFTISPTQLERWRSNLWLARTGQCAAAGSVNGTTATDTGRLLHQGFSQSRNQPHETAQLARPTRSRSVGLSRRSLRALQVLA